MSPSGKVRQSVRMGSVVPRCGFCVKLGALPLGFVSSALRRWVKSTLAAKGTRVCEELLCVVCRGLPSGKHNQGLQVHDQSSP